MVTPAARRAHGRCSTVAVDGMVFHEPVFVGDEVSLYADLLRVGRTSMTIRVEAWRRSSTDETRRNEQGGQDYRHTGLLRTQRPAIPKKDQQSTGARDQRHRVSNQ